MNTPKSTRRDFLRTSGGILAAGAAAPYSWTSASSRAESPNDKLVVAAIGVGDRGSLIAQQAAELDQVVACCDVHRGNARRFADGMAKQGGRCKVYTDYRELLAKEQGIDAVTIGTPDHWHVKIAIDALKAGKHIYCEKPLTLTLEEGTLIRAAVAKYGKIFQVGTQQRSDYDRVFLKAVAIARSGRLGKHLHAICSVGKAASRTKATNAPFGPFPTQEPPAELNWDMWLGQAPAVPFCPKRINWSFRWWFEYSGGEVTDWVHHTDIAMWALAGNDGQAVEAEAKSCKFMFVEREKVRDFLLGKVPAKDMPVAFNVAHEFDVDIKLSTGNTINLNSNPIELLIMGDSGRIRVTRDQLNGKLTGKPVEDVDADPKAQQEIEELMAQIYGGSLPAEKLGHMRNFFDCVKRGKQPVGNVGDHVRSVNANHLANISMLLNRKVRWDIDKQQFIGDAEANMLVRRTQRAPYTIEV